MEIKSYLFLREYCSNGKNEVSMKILVYAGSFDPLTLGHLDIIKRASALCAKLVVLISNSQGKQYHFSLEQRLALVTEATKSLQNIEVQACQELLANYMKEKSYTYLLRGIRSVSDISFEESMSATNKILNSSLETIFLLSDPQYRHLSSSLVKELLPYSVDWAKFVPACVGEYIKQSQSSR